MRIPKRKSCSVASGTKVIALELYRAVCKVESIAGRASCISCHQRRFKLLAKLSHHVLHVQTLGMVAQGILINDLAGGVNLSIRTRSIAHVGGITGWGLRFTENPLSCVANLVPLVFKTIGIVEGMSAVRRHFASVECK
jgi:hypothetical protein